MIPKSPAAAANGQYILIERETYDAVGGHAAVAGNFLEDLAMARVVKQSGRKIFFRFGGDAVRTRMYRGFAQLREGWTRSLVPLFPSPARLAALRALEFVLIIAGFTISLVIALRGGWQPAIAAGILGVILYALFSPASAGRTSPGTQVSWLCSASLCSHIYCCARPGCTRPVVCPGRAARILMRGVCWQLAADNWLLILMVYLTRKAEFSASHYYHNPGSSRRRRTASSSANAIIPTATAITTPLKSRSKARSIRAPASSSISSNSKKSCTAKSSMPWTTVF